MRPLLLLLGLALAVGPADAQRASKKKKPSAPAVMAAAPVSAPAPSRCGATDEPAKPAAPVGDPAWVALAQGDPRAYLVQVAETAMQRSRGVNVAALLEAAARDDIRDAQAGGLPQAQLNLTSGWGGSQLNRVNQGSGVEGRASLQIGGPLWDWGRQQQLVEWRRQLSEAAAANRANAAEQVALQAVSLSLDRSRYALQAQVYGQYVRKMACLVEALQTITQLDPGRASELVQAQKNQQQADLALVGTQDLLRSTETRLRRFVGDPLPPVASLSAVLARLPELSVLQKDLLEAPDVNAATAQALAAQRQVAAAAAGQKPQVSWVGSANAAAGNGRRIDYLGGVQVNVPLWRPTDEPQLTAARRRAEAANVQRDDALDAKGWRLLDIHESAGSSLDRAQRITELLRASQTVRAATLQQWQQLGRRSLFDVMGAEADYYSLRVAHINAIYDAQQAVAVMGSMGRGVVSLLK
jgi:outer membrane protein, adhesin transport system